MMLEILKAEPEKRIPVALALVCIGLMLSVVLNSVWSRVAWLNTVGGAQWNDFAHGFAIGVGIVIEVCGVVLLVGRKRPGKS